MSQHRILLPKTDHTVVTLAPGDVVELAFDTHLATCGREEDALLITTNTGGTVRVLGFFSANASVGTPDDSPGDAASAADGLPRLIIEGESVSAADFLAPFAPEIDTAAGNPAASGPAAGGIGEYLSDPGQLIGGVARLGSLDTIYWSQVTEKAPEYESPIFVAASAATENPQYPGTDPEEARQPHRLWPGCMRFCMKPGGAAR